jgi:beta-glucosidase
VAAVSAAPGPTTAGAAARLNSSRPLMGRRRYWQDGWRYEPGAYRLRVGTSAVDLPLTAQVELT